jgi:hypothetical protein
MDRLAYTTTCG